MKETIYYGCGNRYTKAYYDELLGMEREYKMAEKEAKMREPIMSGLTAVEAAQMLQKEVLSYNETAFVQALEKLRVIKFKEEQIVTYAGKLLNDLSNKELVEYMRIEFARSFACSNEDYDLLFKEMSRRLGQ